MVCRSMSYHLEKLVIFSIHFVVDIYKVNYIFPQNGDLVPRTSKDQKSHLVHSLNLTEEENKAQRG